MTSRLLASAKNVVTEAAIRSPMPCTSATSAAVAACSRSMLPKRAASCWATRSPTIGMPSALSSRARPRVLLDWTAPTRFSADFSAKRSRSATSSAVSSYRSAKFRTRPRSTSCSTTASPRCSMSIARREPKWRSRSLSWAGQAVLVQRQ